MIALAPLSEKERAAIMAKKRGGRLIQYPLDPALTEAAHYCRSCQRPLSNPTSVRLGIGPICRGKRGIAVDTEETYAAYEDKPIPGSDPIVDGVWVNRVTYAGGGWECYTNVPHLCCYHSPTGYEWGYGGSGPADLALNIVELALRRKGVRGLTVPLYDDTEALALSVELHQAFKWAFIAPMDRDSGRIPWAAVEDWLADHVPPEAWALHTLEEGAIVTPKELAALVNAYIVEHTLPGGWVRFPEGWQIDERDERLAPLAKKELKRRGYEFDRRRHSWALLEPTEE